MAELNLAELNESLYRSMYQIRRFEELILENFSKGLFFGTTHTYIGQEANAVGILSNLSAGDIVFSNHRCHGHFLAYGGEPRALFAELMGKATGVCGGRGGSQHLHWKDFYSNGVQGGIVPTAVGMALAEKFFESSAITVVFLGDGTLGEGVVYEALNMASLWQAPILFVVENNHIAQTTPLDLALAGEISTRFTAFGIEVTELDTSDVLEIYNTGNTLKNQIRLLSSPRALILSTYRFGPHSKGDDTRTKEEVEKIKKQRDPLQIQASKITRSSEDAIKNQVEEEIQAAFKQAMSDPYSEPQDL